ncbi:hypothetical protein LY76DRAFT_27727 [Colletotrichum caudatum]|nr:hypothetical protein LY76DRAFT_27727 [Colletotrichum caudatum]
MPVMRRLESGPGSDLISPKKYPLWRRTWVGYPGIVCCIYEVKNPWHHGWRKSVCPTLANLGCIIISAPGMGKGGSRTRQLWLKMGNPDKQKASRMLVSDVSFAECRVSAYLARGVQYATQSVVGRGCEIQTVCWNFQWGAPAPKNPIRWQEVNSCAETSWGRRYRYKKGPLSLTSSDWRAGMSTGLSRKAQLLLGC